MYSTCLFCHAPLGANDAIEHFPVGRRLAFDAAQGRLWVVCRRCERWNLTPLEERWEAIEECERLFRETRLRVSTDNVGLARLAEGTELVRIGAPQRPELAAWRYGDQFGRRRRRTLVASAAMVGIGGALVATGAISALAAAVPGGMGLVQIPNLINLYRTSRLVVARLPDDDGAPLIVRHPHARRAELVPAEDGRSAWGLRVEHDRGAAVLHGRSAEEAMRRILPLLNRAGGSARDVRSAVDRIEQAGSPERLLAEWSTRSESSGAPVLFSPALARAYANRYRPHALRQQPLPVRLALEMAVNEESERRALEGELAQLEAQWKEAEEIAAIADSLALPDVVAERFRRLKGRSGPDG